MTNPTREEIISAHDALETLCARVPEDTPVYAMKSLILAALPPKPRPTMADVKWDDDKHFLAEAETEMGTKVIMLWEAIPERIAIIEDGVMGYVRHEGLTLTGKRYTLTEVQE